MRKKKMLMLTGLSLLATVLIVVTLIFMVKHQPNFYRRADVPAGKGRKELSSACIGRFLKLGACWADGKGDWDVTFSEAQINSYFEEDFIRQGDAEVLRKQGFTDPRIVMENGKLRLACRYGTPPWSTIISYDLKLWLAPKADNVMCVEILGRHAGALPISSQSLLNDITEAAGRHGIDVTWYRHQSNPVAVIRFPADQNSRLPPHLFRLDIKQGLISIVGQSLEPQLTDSMKHALVPVGN
jgi:hypothetical protein